MEAVVAMFLVVVLVGAVFSALMSSRRAIVSSSEKEEVLYSLQSAYGMLKDCRSNPECHLSKWHTDSKPCPSLFNVAGVQNLKKCDNLFTFNFSNLCKEDDSGIFQYKVISSPETPVVGFINESGKCTVENLKNFNILAIEAECQETL